MKHVSLMKHVSSIVQLSSFLWDSAAQIQFLRVYSCACGQFAFFLTFPGEFLRFELTDFA
jgi:hypothetical protein